MFFFNFRSDEASEEPRLLDIPRDTSSKDEPFFKLPLPDEGEQDEYDDVVVIGVDDDDVRKFPLSLASTHTF